MKRKAFEDGEKFKNDLSAFFAGLALFFSVFYVVSLNPSILSGTTSYGNSYIGVPAPLALSGTLLIIVVGNAIILFRTKTGLIIAPAIGISAFFIQFGIATETPWQLLMLACFVAGLASLIAAKCGLRSIIVRSLPHPVKFAFSAALSALFIKTALDIHSEFDSFYDVVCNQNCLRHAATDIMMLLCMLCAFFLLFMTFFRRTNIYIKYTSTGSDFIKSLKKFIFHLDVVLVVVFISVFTSIFFQVYFYEDSVVYSLSWYDFSGIESAFSGALISHWILAFVFAVVVAFTLIIDIPGTPDAVFGKSFREVRDSDKDPQGQKLFRSSLAASCRAGIVTDSALSALSPIAGTTPTLYYAENNILRGFDRFGALVGLTFTFSFAVVALTFLAQHFQLISWNFSSFIPSIALMPILFWIGLFILMQAYIDQGNFRESRKSAQSDFWVVHICDYFPAVFATVATFYFGFDWALMVTPILFFTLRHFLAPENRQSARRSNKLDFAFVGVVIGSSLALFLRLGLELHFLNKSI